MDSAFEYTQELARKELNQQEALKSGEKTVLLAQEFGNMECIEICKNLGYHIVSDIPVSGYIPVTSHVYLPMPKVFWVYGPRCSEKTANIVINLLRSNVVATIKIFGRLNRTCEQVLEMIESCETSKLVVKRKMM